MKRSEALKITELYSHIYIDSKIAIGNNPSGMKLLEAISVLQNTAKQVEEVVGKVEEDIKELESIELLTSIGRNVLDKFKWIHKKLTEEE